jgi:acyl-coenzyme A synthetase/AMP-(fatty) acid ligase
MFGVDLKVIDEKGNRAPRRGGSGELFVRSATIVSGYFNNPGIRQADRQRRLVQHRRRGQDHARQLAADRRPHQGPGEIGGEWISSIDVEKCRTRGEGRINCAVIGVPHPVERAAAAGGVKAPSAKPEPRSLGTLAASIARVADARATWCSSMRSP